MSKTSCSIATSIFRIVATGGAAVAMASGIGTACIVAAACGGAYLLSGGATKDGDRQLPNRRR